MQAHHTDATETTTLRKTCINTVLLRAVNGVSSVPLVHSASGGQTASHEHAAGSQPPATYALS
jgi:hypothetical protein